MNHPDWLGAGRIQSPADLKRLSESELDQLADEMRAELIGVVGRRSAHFASNLGVVELCLALHLTFDFTQDRLIWDTGHQIYPHKLITGRAAELHTIRTKGGLMGYPNPAESPFDLFMTGHAGCASSTALGLEGRRRADRPAPIGTRWPSSATARLPSGIVFEALNHASGLKKKLLVILNDNKMSICPRVGGLADYLDRARMSTHLQRLEQAGQVRSCPTSPWSASTPSAGSSSSRTRSRPRSTTGCSSRSWGSSTSARSTATTSRPCAATSRRSRRWTGRSCCTS